MWNSASPALTSGRFMRLMIIPLHGATTSVSRSPNGSAPTPSRSPLRAGSPNRRPVRKMPLSGARTQLLARATIGGAARRRAAVSAGRQLSRVLNEAMDIDDRHGQQHAADPLLQRQALQAPDHLDAIDLIAVD